VQRASNQSSSPETAWIDSLNSKIEQQLESKIEQSIEKQLQQKIENDLLSKLEAKIQGNIDQRLSKTFEQSLQKIDATVSSVANSFTNLTNIMAKKSLESNQSEQANKTAIEPQRPPLQANQPQEAPTSKPKEAAIQPLPKQQPTAPPLTTGSSRTQPSTTPPPSSLYQKIGSISVLAPDKPK